MRIGLLFIGVDRRGAVPPDGCDRGGWFVDFRVWLERPKWSLPLFLVRAAPTCTLYRRADDAYLHVLRFWPHWSVSDRQIREAFK